MRFLLDQNISPALVDLLAAAGHDVVHVRQLDLSRASDDQVMAAAKDGGRVIVSGDTDFGELLAHMHATAPSILLLRRQRGRRADQIVELIVANLEAVAGDLQAGAIVVFDDTRIRIRSLPIDA